VLAVAAVFALSNVSGVSRVVAAVGGYLILTTGVMFADALGFSLGGMKEAAALIVFFDVGSILSVWQLREHINVPFLLLVGIPWTVFELIGTKVLVGNDKAPWMTTAFGALLLLVLTCDAFEKWRKAKQSAAAPTLGAEPRLCCDVSPTHLGHGVQMEEIANAAGTDPEPKDLLDKRFDIWAGRNFSWCLFLGITGGLLKGMFTVPMPALCVFVLFSGIDKDQWRANMILMNLLSLPFKAYLLFVVEQEFQSHRLPQYIATVLGVVAANPVGNYVAAVVDKDQFKDIVRMLTFTGACSMLARSAGRDMQLWMSLGALLLGSLLMCLRWRRMRRGPPAGAQRLEEEEGDSDGKLQEPTSLDQRDTV